VALSSPVEITYNDRVGLYTTSAYQLPVPFQHDQTASLYYSTETVTNNSFALSQRISLDELYWRRSLRKYVVFCKTPGLSLFTDLEKNAPRIFPFLCRSL